LTTVPAALRAILAGALRAELGVEIELPEKLQIGRVQPLKTPDSRISLLPRPDGADYVVTAVARWHPGNDEFEVFSHHRIHSDGRIEPLENLEGQYGMPSSDDPVERERLRGRISAHNARVRAILYRKGFLSAGRRPAFLDMGQYGFRVPEPSDSLDPGEWLIVADEHAFRPDTIPGDLELARHAVQQVMKFLPEGAERVPDQAFHTPRGRYVLDADPTRFRRVRLQGMLDAYLAPSTSETTRR